MRGPTFCHGETGWVQILRTAKPFGNFEELCKRFPRWSPRICSLSVPDMPTHSSNAPLGESAPSTTSVVAFETRDQPDCFFCGAVLFISGALLVCPADAWSIDHAVYTSVYNPNLKEKS